MYTENSIQLHWLSAGRVKEDLFLNNGTLKFHLILNVKAVSSYDNLGWKGPVEASSSTFC